MRTDTAKIKQLNDDLRQNLLGGLAVVTPGVAALGADRLDLILRALAAFDDFGDDNDPYGEHDFGSFKLEGVTLAFKIDYYDAAMKAHSPDPADPAVTERVITLMLLSEY